MIKHYEHILYILLLWAEWIISAYTFFTEKTPGGMENCQYMVYNSGLGQKINTCNDFQDIDIHLSKAKKELRNNLEQNHHPKHINMNKSLFHMYRIISFFQLYILPTMTLEKTLKGLLYSGLCRQ